MENTSAALHPAEGRKQNYWTYKSLIKKSNQIHYKRRGGDREANNAPLLQLHPAVEQTESKVRNITLLSRVRHTTNLTKYLCRNAIGAA